MFDWIEFIVCFGEKLTPDEVKVNDRDVELVYARQLIFYFARRYDCGTLKWIGERYGRDHATVMHSIKSIENYIDTDKVKKGRIDYYKELIDKVKGLLPKGDEINKMLSPLSKQLSELESRCINLSLQISFLKSELSKITPA